MDWLLERLEADRVGVIAASGGGPHAVAFVRRYPQRVAALVLQAAVSHRWDSARWLPRRYRPFYPVLKQRGLWRLLYRLYQFELWRYSNNIAAFLKRMSGRRYPAMAKDPEAGRIARRIVESMVRCLPFAAGTENDVNTFFNETWLEPGRIRCPTLVIHDRLDPIVPFAHAEWAIEAIAGAELLDVETAGHIVWAGRDAERMRRCRTEFLHRHAHADSPAAPPAHEEAFPE
jgi:pimeloyl-ACP methyl ester carboxylesterase